MSEWLKSILMRIYHYRICIMYKPGCELYIAEWLSRHIHTKNKDGDIVGMNINANFISIKCTTDTPTCVQ